MDQQADLAGALVVIPKLKSEADYREFLPGPFYKFARTRSLIRALLTRLPLSTFNIPAQYFPNHAADFRTSPLSITEIPQAT
jgi:hypothetical protein